MLRVGDVDAGDRGEPRERDRLQAEPGRHQRASADPVGQRARDRRHEHRHDRPRQRPHAGLERRVALHGLQELREQEDRAEGAEVHRQRDEVGGREGARAEQPQRQHRRRGARLPEHERGQRRARRRRAPPSTCGDVQPRSLPRTMPHTSPARPAVASVAPTRSSRTPGPWLSSSRRLGEHDRDDADGDVEPEDPVPRDAVDDRAADQRAGRDGDAGDAGPDAERHAALAFGERRGQQRQRQRRDDRAADALDGAGRDQRVGGRGQRGRRGGGGEQPEAEPEHAAAAEPVAERRPGQEQHRERQRVRVHEPLQVVDRGAQVAPDARQGGRHDEVVEHRHEQREAGHDQRVDTLAIHRPTPCNHRITRRVVID